MRHDGASTSKASTTTTAVLVEWACEFLSPVTRIVSVCLPEVRPSSVTIGVWISFGRAKVSTRLPGPPSTLTRAIPPFSLRAPIHLTEVPVKVNVAVAPTAVDCMAVPPLHAKRSSVGVHAPLKLTAASDSSKRPRRGNATAAAVSGAAATGNCRRRRRRKPTCPRAQKYRPTPYSASWIIVPRS
jgi:hypothetical protein